MNNIKAHIAAIVTIVLLAVACVVFILKPETMLKFISLLFGCLVGMVALSIIATAYKYLYDQFDYIFSKKDGGE